MSLSIRLSKKSPLEETEDKFDIAVADEAYQNYLDSGCKTTTVADFWEELDNKM